MKTFTNSTAARGALAVAGAVAAVLLAVGGATAATPGHVPHHRSGAGHFSNSHHRRHHSTYRFHGRHRHLRNGRRSIG